MCLGWISDNIDGDRDEAPTHYEQGLAPAGPRTTRCWSSSRSAISATTTTTEETMRVRSRWQESTSEAARAGHVAGVLAQQLLLAVLARDAGDEAGARSLATEVRRWAEAIEANQIARQSADFLAGVDPTRAPDAEDAEAVGS